MTNHGQIEISNPPTKKGGCVDFETHGRAWLKSLIWRLMGIVILGAISWIITHDWKEMTSITILFHGIRMLLYYVHERIWNRVTWGRIRHPLSIFPVTRAIDPQDQAAIRKHLKTMGYLD